MRLFKFLVFMMCLGLPFFLTFINHRFLHKRLGNLALWLMACVVCWLLIQGSVQLVEWYLLHQLDSFVLDHDGVFSGNELTLEQAQAMYRVTNDTGRALAPITGAIASIGYNTMVFMVLACFSFNKRKKSQR